MEQPTLTCAGTYCKVLCIIGMSCLCKCLEFLTLTIAVASPRLAGNGVMIGCSVTWATIADDGATVPEGLTRTQKEAMLLAMVFPLVLMGDLRTRCRKCHMTARLVCYGVL